MELITPYYYKSFSALLKNSQYRYGNVPVADADRVWTVDPVVVITPLLLRFSIIALTWMIAWNY